MVDGMVPVSWFAYNSLPSAISTSAKYHESSMVAYTPEVVARSLGERRRVGMALVQVLEIGE